MEPRDSQEPDVVMMETGGSQESDAAMETGECSAPAIPLPKPWAKLVPLDSKYSDVEIALDEMVVCSETSFLSLDKHEWCKIAKKLDKCSATLQNLSSISINVDGVVIEKGDAVAIKHDSAIVSGTDNEGYLSYRFEVTPISKYCKIPIKIPFDIEHAKCSICLNIWHDVVTVAPCLHNFCNGCFSEWLRRSLKNGSSVLCPHCRGIVHFVGRNHFLHNIEQALFGSDASLQRSNEEVAYLDRRASIKTNLIGFFIVATVVARGGGLENRRRLGGSRSDHGLVIKNSKAPRRGMSYFPLNDESDGMELSCPQCGIEFRGFQCNQATVHLQCSSCGGMMPSRSDISVPQHCLGCDRSFCGSYWLSQGLSTNVPHTFCSHENFKPIFEHTIVRIPSSTHQNNQHEQDITERCIRSMGRTLQDVVLEWIGKLDNREIDRTIMPLNHADMITARTHVCKDCYDKLVSFLLYWFRVTIPHYSTGSADLEVSKLFPITVTKRVARDMKVSCSAVTFLICFVTLWPSHQFKKTSLHFRSHSCIPPIRIKTMNTFNYLMPQCLPLL
ncbi:hypothetical protein Scep_019408 [Stephania cephalantha]|uniref:RING-type domain-containing protein n=1 Tax=Stephania cephalantha TaxID=152367 RepID=A0AAP0IAM1_9MAGN